MESLAKLLSEQLLASSTHDPLTPWTIVVPHQGIKHWLSLLMANERAVAANLKFPLLSRYLWDVVNNIQGDEARGLIWTREVMSWRIYRLLQDDELMSTAVFAEPREYLEKTTRLGGQFQLAWELADLFEQYMQYRHDMLLEWQEAQEPDDWQAALWQRLVAGKVTPVEHLRNVLRKMERGEAQVAATPVHLFAVNTMAPIWLEFLNRLSSLQDIHIYVLNPCREWWGDLETRSRQLRKQAHAVKLGKSMTLPDDAALEALEGHLLLARLGRQGQAFFNSLAELDSGSESPVWEVPTGEHALARVQRSLLDLAPEEAVSSGMDGSLRVVSAHSPLREVQAVHDWLLSVFESNPELTPMDVVIMAPEVETYAPVVEAVFDVWGEGRPDRLPATVADRLLSQTDPLVKTLLELLRLPDARLEKNWVVEQMRQPAARARWGWDEESLQTLENWLERAAIFRGYDAEHMATLGLAHNASFTWDQGLRRLLLGAVVGDQAVVLPNEKLTTVEDIGTPDDLNLLGRLMGFLDALDNGRRALGRQRTARQWADLLMNWLQELFQETPDNSDSWQRIRSVLRDWVAAVELATEGSSLELPLTAVREALEQALSKPLHEGGYLAGKVTVCSLTPLRNVPFKVVCLLGMNAEAFPRISRARPFDKMAQDPRWGDRSRRDDDLYLFLEAILSARQALYISYEGRSIRDDSEKQPSDLVRLLMDCTGILRPIELPLQPFDNRHFHPGSLIQSFDARWLRILSHESEDKSSQAVPDDEQREGQVLSVSDMARWFDEPVECFAKETLGLRIDVPERDPESEPFELSGLENWKLADEWLNLQLAGKEVDRTAWIQKQMWGGRLPDAPDPAVVLEGPLSAAETLLEEIEKLLGTRQPDRASWQCLVGNDLRMEATAWTGGGNIALIRPAQVKNKDMLAGHLLMLTLIALSDRQPEMAEGTVSIIGLNDKKSLKTISVARPGIEAKDAREVLMRLAQLMQTPRSCPWPVPLDVWWNKKNEKGAFEGRWRKFLKERQYSRNNLSREELPPYSLFWPAGLRWCEEYDHWIREVRSVLMKEEWP
jgi:exodeoxyribonuclease V gamma subunit